MMTLQYEQSVWRFALPGGESTSHQHIALKVKVGQCPSVGIQHMLRLHGGMVEQGYLQKNNQNLIPKNYFSRCKII